MLLLKDALPLGQGDVTGEEVREAAATVGRDEGNWDQEERGKWTTGKILEVERPGLLCGPRPAARGCIRRGPQGSGSGG